MSVAISEYKYLQYVEQRFCVLLLPMWFLCNTSEQVVAVFVLQVSAEAADSLLDLKLTDLLAEQQSISADSKETVGSHTDPDEGQRTI